MSFWRAPGSGRSWSSSAPCSPVASSCVIGSGRDPELRRRAAGTRAPHRGAGNAVAVVGDGAVGLCAIIAARQLGAERIIAFSRHPDRQRLAREFGATDIVEERGDDAAAKVKELTGGYGAHSTIEAVGAKESMSQAIHSTRAGGYVGYVGVPIGAEIDAMDLFATGVQLAGGVAPVRRFLPNLVQLVLDDQINPGAVFDLTLPLDQAAEGYQAMDERRAIKVLLTS